MEFDYAGGREVGGMTPLRVLLFGLVILNVVVAYNAQNYHSGLGWCVAAWFILTSWDD